MLIEREIRFKVGEGAWSLGIKTFENAGIWGNVQFGFYWADKPFPTHDANIPIGEFIQGLQKLGLLDYAQTSPQRQSVRDTSEEELSSDEVLRAWVDAYSRATEEPSTSRSESSGGGQSDGNDYDGFPISGRDYFSKDP